MKLQVAGLCLADQKFLQFRITPTPDLLHRLERNEGEVKEHLRDELRRRLRRAIHGDPWFFFAIEDLSADGESVDVHIHGSVLVRPVPLPLTSRGIVRARWARLLASKGQTLAETMHGIHVLKQVIKDTAGPNREPSMAWAKQPVMHNSNPEWISYSLKNMFAPSANLPDRRMVISRGLTQEATRLWELIRRGPSALSLWDDFAP